MPVIDEQLAALRAFLRQDAEQIEYQHQRLAEVDGVVGYERLVYAAFSIAVRRRFAARWSIPDIVRYVARARIALSDSGLDIDPHVAEVQVRRALGDAVFGEFDDQSKARTQILVLAQLIDDEGLDDTRMSEFLEAARSFTDSTVGFPGSHLAIEPW
jgi:hypothetical protein